MPSRVRIAVIDTGVDSTLEGISEYIEQGQSFVTSNGWRESPWWVASDPHGTQMATIIRRLDPLCKLLIAKVGTTRDDININNLIPVRHFDPNSIFDLELTNYRQFTGPGPKKSISLASA